MSKILIIEDDPTIKSQYAFALKRLGHTVREARNAKEGLEALGEFEPDLIMLDLLMPGTDGIAFLKTADIPHQYPGTKILITSNVQTPELTRQLSRLTIDRYILKAEYTPYTLAELVTQMTQTGS